MKEELSIDIIGLAGACSYGKAELSGVCKEVYEVQSEERVTAYGEYGNLLGDSKSNNSDNKYLDRRMASI